MRDCNMSSTYFTALNLQMFIRMDSKIYSKHHCHTVTNASKHDCNFGSTAADSAVLGLRNRPLMQTILMSAEYNVLQPDVNTVDRIDISPTGPPHLRGKTTLNVTKSVSDRADGIS